jgi:hypothetical protein
MTDEPNIPLMESDEAQKRRDDATETLPDGKNFSVPRPLVGTTPVESVTVELSDGQVVHFDDRVGVADESRVFPDVIEFETREIHGVDDE